MATLMIIDHIVRTQILQQLSARSDVEEEKKEEVTSKDFNHCLKLIYHIKSGVSQPSGRVHPCLHWDWLEQRCRDADSETLWAPAVPRRPSLANLPEVFCCKVLSIRSINDVLNIQFIKCRYFGPPETRQPDHICAVGFYPKEIIERPEGDSLKTLVDNYTACGFKVILTL